MRTIPKERILRVNCPGYGTDSHWNLGRAKGLNNYSAIIVNPVSIAHLFDKDPELVRKVDQRLAEGNTSLTIDDDLLLRNLAAEIDSRVLELSDFLTQGGVLVYFLCRPFVIQGPSLALDNYYWLESLAPDQPEERNVRHMSAVSHGRLIEPTEDGSASEFAPYLLQHGLEWSTLIRNENLTEGYSVMAEAGSKKCIAGQLFILESSGKVVFLPSPYSPDFDKTLIECLNAWYALKEQSPEELEAEQNESRTYASMAAQEAPQTGSGLFEREQSQYEPVANAVIDTGSESSTHSGSFETATAASPAANSDFSFNADKIAEDVSQDAKRFEEEVASRVAKEPKKPTANIDLSIFAQTARQLVQKTTDTPDATAATPNAETKAPGVESGSFASVAAEPAQEPVAESPTIEEVDEQPTFEAPEAIGEASYEIPPETVTRADSSNGGGSSLRNLLSHVAPLLPAGLKADVPSTASALLAESGNSEFSPVPAPAPSQPVRKTAASLFSDDDEFESMEMAAVADEEPTQSAASQRDVDTSDQNSGIYSQPDTSFSQPPEIEPSDNSGAYDAGSSDSGFYSQPASEAKQNTDSGIYNQVPAESPANSSGAYSEPQLESPSNNSGVYSQPQLPPSSTSSGDFNTVSDPADSGVHAQQSEPALEPEPVYTPPQADATPPPAEPATILQPPSGFMSDPAAQTVSQPVENVEQVEPSMAQTPAPSDSTSGDNSAVTNNDNKSTMDLLRELEKAQRPPEQPRPQTAPGGVKEGVRPLLNNLFKKDTNNEGAPLENTPPAVPQSAPPAVQHASTPAPPVPARNTLGALMQPASESRVTVPQESLAMNREGSNAMTNMVVPDWCKQYSFSYLDELKKEQATLASELQDIQAKLNTVESKIASVEQLKAALLSGDSDSLKEATGLVLAKLGWTININNATPNEVLLLNVDQPEAIVRIVRSDAHCDRSEVAQVSGSAIAFWEKHDIEPKGLLIACTWANVSPQSRNQKDFEEPVSEFAKKKNLCLITSIQMLGIYRDLELGLVTPDAVRRQMLETNGLLTGYAVESANMVGARA